MAHLASYKPAMVWAAWAKAGFQSVNVAIAMTIAVFKGLLVMMFFMQLKYDHPLNSMIFATCLLAFGAFLGLTALDLFGRDSIDREREGEIHDGGFFSAHDRYEQVFNEKTGEWEMQYVSLSGSGMSIMERAKFRDRGPDEQRVTDHHEDPVEFSSADRTIPMTGLHLFAVKHEPGEQTSHQEDDQGEDHEEGDEDGHTEESGDASGDNSADGENEEHDG